MGVQIGGSQRECRGEDAGWVDPGGRERRPFPHAAVKPDCSNAFCGVKASLAKKLVSNPVGDEGVWAAAAARRGRREPGEQTRLRPFLSRSRRDRAQTWSSAPITAFYHLSHAPLTHSPRNNNCANKQIVLDLWQPARSPPTGTWSCPDAPLRAGRQAGEPQSACRGRHMLRQGRAGGEEPSLQKRFQGRKGDAAGRLGGERCPSRGWGAGSCSRHRGGRKGAYARAPRCPWGGRSHGATAGNPSRSRARPGTWKTSSRAAGGRPSIDVR